MDSEGNAKRIDSFDILKTIAIFMVVFCHYTVLSDSIPDNFFMTICYVAVPLFFMINGALLLNKPFNMKKHLVKTASVYAISVVWRVIYLIISLIESGSAESVLSLKQETLAYLFLWTPSTLVNTGHMWFMRSLLIVYLIFPLLHVCFQQGKNGRMALYSTLAVLFVCVFCVTECNVLLSYLEEKTPIHLYTNADPIASFSPYTQGSSLFFFVLGAILQDRLNESSRKAGFPIPTKKQRVIIGVLFVVSWVYMIWTKTLTDGTWHWNDHLYQNGYQRIPTVVSTVLLFLLFWNVTIRREWLRKSLRAISSYTLGIYYLHWSILPFIEPLFTWRGVFANTLKTVIAMALCGALIFVLKFIPFVRKLVK